MLAKVKTFAVVILLIITIAFFINNAFSFPFSFFNKDSSSLMLDKKLVLAMADIKLTVTPLPTPTPTPTPTLTPTPTSTPTPTPTPQPIITSQDLDNLFSQYSKEYGVDKELLKRIAYCESRMNARALNGPYAGIFQFSDTLWTYTRNIMNKDPNPELRFNAEESIRTASFKISQGGIMAWKNCVN